MTCREKWTGIHDHWNAFGMKAPRLLLRNPKVIETLQVEPQLSACAKKMGEAKGGVARNRPPSIQDLRDPIRWHSDLSREFSRAHIELFEFFGQMFAGMNSG